jgi:hypothetical protein
VPGGDVVAWEAAGLDDPDAPDANDLRGLPEPVELQVVERTAVAR